MSHLPHIQILPFYHQMFQRLNLGRVRLRYSGIRIYSGIYSGYSASGSRIAGMEIQVFRNEKSSQTNAYSHYSNYSYSGLIPNERALSVVWKLLISSAKSEEVTEALFEKMSDSSEGDSMNQAKYSASGVSPALIHGRFIHVQLYSNHRESSCGYNFHRTPNLKALWTDSSCGQIYCSWISTENFEHCCMFAVCFFFLSWFLPLLSIVSYFVHAEIIILPQLLLISQSDWLIYRCR